MDWLKIRFKTLNFKAIITHVLKLRPTDFFHEEKSLYSYSDMVTYGSVRVLYSHSEKKGGGAYDFFRVDRDFDLRDRVHHCDKKEITVPLPR